MKNKMTKNINLKLGIIEGDLKRGAKLPFNLGTIINVEEKPVGEKGMGLIKVLTTVYSELKDSEEPTYGVRAYHLYGNELKQQSNVTLDKEMYDHWIKSVK